VNEIEQAIERNRNAGVSGLGEIPAPPRRKLAVVTCMDARIDAHRLLGLEPGDAHVIRNAGGVVTDDVIRSVAVSQRKLGTREVMVIQHTGCGMIGLSDDEFRSELEQETGVRPAWSAEGFRDLEQEVRQGVERLRRSPFLLHRDAIAGFVLELESGLLRRVV